MIVQRPQCFALFLVWITSFYLLWKLLCIFEITKVYNEELESLKRNQTSVEVAEDKNETQSYFEELTRKWEALTGRRKSKENKKITKSDQWNINVTHELQALAKKYSCRPVENIAFIKTHKTGGSTITNIVNRFADLRELVVALPAAGDYRFQWPSKFHWTFADLLRLDGETANILGNHARYQRSEMDIIMKRNTKYITILREPVKQFVSSFYYFEFDKILGLQHRKNPLEEFLKDPDKHLYSLSMRLGDLPDVMNLIQSGMMYDLGYDFLEFANGTVVSKAIRTLESELDLVLILEHFDESLVLMKRQFCWDFDDILYIKMNAMKYKTDNITNSMRQEILKWNAADFKLYKRFNQTLWSKIRKQGQGFWEDVTEFRRRNAAIRRKCSPREVEEKAFGGNVKIKGLVMGSRVDRYHRSFCTKMMMNEVQYLQYFRYKFGKTYGYQRILQQEGVEIKKFGELSARIRDMRAKRYKFLKK